MNTQRVFMIWYFDIFVHIIYFPAPFCKSRLDAISPFIKKERHGFLRFIVSRIYTFTIEPYFVWFLGCS